MLRCHTPPQCGRAPLRHHGRRESPPAAAPGVVVRCARGAPQVPGIEAASPGHAAATAAKAEGGDARPSLAERLRLGSLLEDGLSYKESFIVRCYEVGINKTATVETIANLLQVRSRARAVGSLLPKARICALRRPDLWREAYLLDSGYASIQEVGCLDLNLERSKLVVQSELLFCARIGL